MDTPILRRATRTTLSGAVFPRRLTRTTALGAVLALGVLGCNGGPTDPAGFEEGPLRIRPLLQSAVDVDLLDLDAIGVTILDIEEGPAVADTVLSYHGDPETVLAWVLDLEAFPSRVRVEAEAWSGDTRMFEGALETEVDEESPEAASTVHDLEMVFVGPGAEAVAIHVTPSAPMLTFGDTLRFRVTGTDAEGNTVEDVLAFWSSSVPDLAPISRDALLRAPHERGSVRVAAITPTGLTDDAGADFQPAPATLVVVRGDGESARVGSSVPVEVRVVGADGEGVADVDVAFSAQEPGAAVEPAAVTSEDGGSAATTAVLGLAAGDYAFTASAPGIAPVTLVITALPGAAEPGFATITAHPTELPADGTSASTITVQLHDANANALTESGGPVKLSATVGDMSAVVDHGDGTYTALLTSTEAGDALITGTLDADPIDDSATVTFTEVEDPEVATVEVTPGSTALAALGDTKAYTARAFDAEGGEIEGVSFTWSVGNETVAEIGATTGVATAVGNGATTVIATADGVTGTATLTVEQEVASLLLERVCLGGMDSCERLASLGDQVQIVAEALDANGSVVAGADVEWSSGSTTVGIVDESGLVTAVGNGTATITAEADGEAATIEVTVRQAAVHVTVEPSEITLSVPAADAASGPARVIAVVPSEKQLVARAFDANGNPVEDAVFAWLSLDTEVATVDADGLVRAVDCGTTYIKATSDEATGKAKVTVQ